MDSLFCFNIQVDLAHKVSFIWFPSNLFVFHRAQGISHLASFLVIPLICDGNPVATNSVEVVLRHCLLHSAQ